jgi:hypothetical protein
MLDLQPINLFNLPAHLKKQCKHEYCMILHSFKQKWCYDCGAKMPSDSHVPEHQR